MKDMKVKRKKVSLRKLRADAEAISPIVATLMLVLIAVAAASAFYIWESGWQNDQSKQLSNVDVNSGNLVVSGSTTVNDFMTYAAPAFMTNYTSSKVTVDSIGSPQGLSSLEQGTCNVAMISNTIDGTTAGTTSKYPSMVATTIAYDGVVMFVGAAAEKEFGLTAADLQMDTVIAQAIYGTATTAPSITTWGGLAGLEVSEFSLTTGPWTTMDATHKAEPLNVHYRADGSGTQDAFATKFLAGSSTDAYFSSSAWTGYAASASYNMKGSNGNTGMITDVTGDKDAIGFTSYGMVSTSSGQAVAFSFAKLKTDTQVAPTTASILAGVKGTTGGYAATRPLILVTMGQPTGITATFIKFCTDSGNNINFCKATGFISIYS